MSVNDGYFQSLRQKLDVLGYTQTLPLAGIPLANALFEDLVKTTESLRDSKQKLVELLEEKACWELGVEPYKCDNGRLVAECSELHLQNLRERENYEERLRDLNKEIRALQSDKDHLQNQCEELDRQLKVWVGRSAVLRKEGLVMKKDGKKPFVSAVRSGGQLPPIAPLTETSTNTRCVKCNANSRRHTINSTSKSDVEKLEHNIKEVTEEVTYYKRKVAARDREICRLNELMTGGRPPAALAKDCCYKDIHALTEDIEILQREKAENGSKIREFQDQMHEAMQRAIALENTNKRLTKELDDLKCAALQVETEANEEIAEREEEIQSLQEELKKLKKTNDVACSQQTSTARRVAAGDDAGVVSAAEKRRINEKFNELTQKESELKQVNERLHKKVHKLKCEVVSLQKALRENDEQKVEKLDEDKIRLKSERDFFQKEYLRLLNKAGSEKEVDFLQNQVKTKDEELKKLREDLYQQQQQIYLKQQPGSKTTEATNFTSCQLSARSNQTITSDCMQAAVLRAERERDCARAELERVRSERDTLREKHICLRQMQIDEVDENQHRIEALQSRIKQLEHQCHELNSARVPVETQVVLLKEELEDYKHRLKTLQDENHRLKTMQQQMKILSEQTERSLSEYQSKLLIAERQLQSSGQRLKTLDSTCEASCNETTKLRREVVALKETYVAIENEKDKILTQLDRKTERVCQLEHELQTCQEKRLCLEKQLEDLEKQLDKLTSRTRERDTALHETTAERQTLRQQIIALKASRDAAIAENGCLSNDLADSKAEVLMLTRKLKESETEIDRLKQQLRQYVQEVKKAEDLLMCKEKERDEMLEHYRSLSHDAVLLEGNNQTLETEIAEYKRQICELEVDVETLKQEISRGKETRLKFENKIAELEVENNRLQSQLEEAHDEQRLLQVDLNARKELCNKLDVQKDKLNAELMEFNEIRRKLERENETLLKELEKTASGGKVSAESLEELLAKTRRDLEEQIQQDSKLNQEIIRLRQQNDELLVALDVEHQKCKQKETLAHEYQVQNQELRHNLTDDRFRQALSREQTPRLPTQTL